MSTDIGQRFGPALVLSANGTIGERGEAPEEEGE